jgi:nitrogen fixation/metabolism regulation signal transduction histidine kinase
MGNLDVKVPTQSSDELAEMGNLFNNMTAKLKEIDTLKSDYYSFPFP